MHGQRGVGGGVLCACAKRKGEGCSVPVKREMGVLCVCTRENGGGVLGAYAKRNGSKGAVCLCKEKWGAVCSKRNVGAVCLCKEEWNDMCV